MEDYVCNNCRFHFKATAPKTCPFCGKSRTFEKEKSAADLLDEITIE